MIYLETFNTSLNSLWGTTGDSTPFTSATTNNPFEIPIVKEEPPPVVPIKVDQNANTGTNKSAKAGKGNVKASKPKGRNSKSNTTQSACGFNDDKLFESDLSRPETLSSLHQLLMH